MFVVGSRLQGFSRLCCLGCLLDYAASPTRLGPTGTEKTSLFAAIIVSIHRNQPWLITGHTKYASDENVLIHLLLLLVFSVLLLCEIVATNQLVGALVLITVNSRSEMAFLLEWRMQDHLKYDLLPLMSLRPSKSYIHGHVLMHSIMMPLLTMDYLHLDMTR